MNEKLVPNKNGDSFKRVVEELYPFKAYTEVLCDRIKILLKRYLKITKSFFIEEKYIEWEWRESYSIHYSKTSYEDITPYVSRIHFISDDIKNIEDISDKNYTGYITVRPIPSPGNALSRIRLNPLRDLYDLYEDEKLYMMTAPYIVNLPHRKLNIETFPFYSQDSMVSVCAHADMLMISEFMHKKYKLNRPQIECFLREIIPTEGRIIPSQGLTIEQMLISLEKNGYCANLVMFKDGREENSGIEAVDYIDTCVESSIPCILVFDSHVIVFGGHTIRKTENGINIRYIIFDDSGYHIKNTFKKGVVYTTVISRSELQEALKNKAANKDKKRSFLVFIEFDKVFYPYRCLYKFNRNIIIDELKKRYPQLNPQLIGLIKTRSLVINTPYLRQLLAKNGIPSLNYTLIPHYVWFTEWYIGERGIPSCLKYFSIVNASSHKFDTEYISIKSKKNEVLLSGLKKPIGLLKEV